MIFIFEDLYKIKKFKVNNFRNDIFVINNIHHGVPDLQSAHFMCTKSVHALRIMRAV